MAGVVRRLRRSQAGAALVEYALIIAGVALIGAAAVSVFGNGVTDLLRTAAAMLPGASRETNAPVVSSTVTETSPVAPVGDEDKAATGTKPEGIESIPALVVETKNR
ncbi:MAG: hypothetical protein FJW14_16205 [Acidimicrobiia bacterium]|nr:hypothetical protein [Acidimicrobiia bacterium]